MQNITVTKTTALPSTSQLYNLLTSRIIPLIDALHAICPVIGSMAAQRRPLQARRVTKEFACLKLVEFLFHLITPIFCSLGFFSVCVRFVLPRVASRGNDVTDMAV